MSVYDSLKEEAWRCNQELPRASLVTHTFGNASALDRSRGVFAIKPSGVPFDRLRPADMVVMDLDGNVVEGKLRPSSDTKTHMVLYRGWEDIAGIVHTHSPYAVAWAQAGLPIPVLGTTHADALPRDVPCTPVMSDAMIQGDYETCTGELILESLRDLSHREVEMVLVACHGPFTWGATADRAVQNSILLEMIAKAAFITLQINPETPRLKSSLLRKHYERKNGPNRYYGQEP